MCQFITEINNGIYMHSHTSIGTQMSPEIFLNNVLKTSLYGNAQMIYIIWNCFVVHNSLYHNFIARFLGYFWLFTIGNCTKKIPSFCILIQFTYYFIYNNFLKYAVLHQGYLYLKIWICVQIHLQKCLLTYTLKNNVWCFQNLYQHPLLSNFLTFVI